MTPSNPRFDLAVVLIPRTPGDEIVRLGQSSQPLLQDNAATLAAVEQTLDALDRAFHPADPKVAK